MIVRWKLGHEDWWHRTRTSINREQRISSCDIIKVSAMAYCDCNTVSFQLLPLFLIVRESRFFNRPVFRSRWTEIFSLTSSLTGSISNKFSLNCNRVWRFGVNYHGSKEFQMFIPSASGLGEKCPFYCLETNHRHPFPSVTLSAEPSRFIIGTAVTLIILFM
jgi:hypothetical protein